MKKRVLSLFVSILYACWVWPQPCTTAKARAIISNERLTAHINQGGQIFNDNGHSGLLPSNPAGIQKAGTVFSAAVWVAGTDPAENLKISVAGHQPGYFAGPLDPITGQTTVSDCAHWDKVFKISGKKIAEFLLKLKSSVQPEAWQYPEIFGWPAYGNSHFSIVHGFDLPTSTNLLAPFFDANLNGVYEPLLGDHPAVVLRDKLPFVPHEMTWCVFNDQGAGALFGTVYRAFPAETQLTSWVFDCPDQPMLQNTLFTSYKIIQRGTEKVDSVFVGIWVDFDIGCYADDNIGCDTVRNCFFAYNKDIVDGINGADCDFGFDSFGDTIPVQSVTFLDGEMAKFMVTGKFVFNNTPLGATQPALAIEYYNYLTGSWRDGTPLTGGGIGYNPNGGSPTVSYTFPGNPSDPNEWSMCTVASPFEDHQAIASKEIKGGVWPGQIDEINLAWTTHWSSVGYLPCGIAGTLEEVDAVQELFNENFSGSCSPLHTDVLSKNGQEIVLYPNPASEHFNIVVPERQGRFQFCIFSTDGRQIAHARHENFGNVNISTTDLPTGVYVVKIVTDAGIFLRRVVIRR